VQVEALAGKLVLAVQGEWGRDLGEPIAQESEEAMYLSHKLLQAAKAGSIGTALGTATVAEFIGSPWVAQHPNVAPHIEALEAAIRKAADV
jgi:hypothetical protein